ncbi:MAG: hypothetical protein QF893_22970, partial [Alphaproteobacteria bacterium]|nr:hypothetical protein [Alphaproteobacteria bacterium]
NQEKAAEAEKPIGCAHDGRFDYRNAWESDPESLDRAKRKLARIKDDAASRRLRDRPKRG